METKELPTEKNLTAPPRMIHFESMNGTLIAMCGAKCTESLGDRGTDIDCVVCMDLWMAGL